MGAPVIKGERTIEQDIVDKYCTAALIDKEFSKITNETIDAAGNVTWGSKMIPRLLGQVFYCLVTEEAWNMVKEFKYPTIDYKKLNSLTIAKIKEEMKGLFA